MRYDQFLTNYDPFSHQKVAINHVWWHLKTYGSVFLRASMGAGKTKIVIDIVNNHEGINNVLVICPHKAIQVWEHEIDKHKITEKYKYALSNRVCALEDRLLAKKLKNLSEFVSESTIGSINYVIVNYESANKLGLHQIPWDLVVSDESHYMKSHDSIRTKYMYKVSKRSKYRIAMTGTPVGGKYEHIFGQFQFVDERVFGNNYYAFRHKYCVMGGYNDREVIGYKNIEQLNVKYKNRSVEIEVDHNIPTRHIDIILELEDKESKDFYRQQADTLKKAISVNDEMTARACITRMQQITSGYMNVRGNSLMLNYNKIVALKELFGGINENVVVFYRFREDLRRIIPAGQELGYEVFQINGSMNQYKELKSYKGDKPMVIATQIQSGSEAIDLTDARYCIYYSNTHRFLDYTQSLARVARPGQDINKGVIYYHLITKKTVDVSIRKSNDQKEDIMNALIRGDYIEH